MIAFGHLQTQKDEDDFTVDTADPRFQALYESHQYAVDPTNPQYKWVSHLLIVHDHNT